MRIGFAPLFFLTSLCALPTGFEVQQGAAQVEQQGAEMCVLCQKDSVIHWQDFSIGDLESVRFQQLNADSVVLNRVVGTGGSSLNGHLFSNGQIYLINENGIVIGPGAMIFSAGFVASTHNVLDESVLKGAELHFAGDSSRSVINLGTIVCSSGSIALIGKRVENRGTLEAPEGEVSLAAGVDLWLRPEGKQRIFVCPTQQGSGEVLNAGQIQALSIQLEADGNPYVYAIRNEGKLSTPRIQNENGRILLKAQQSLCQVEGELIANGQRGGQIDIFAEEIHIGEANIEAKGADGGGLIRIGGDFQGKTVDGFNASKTWISSKAVISTDALDSGDGGRVIVWGDEWTSHHGQILARGGALRGDGGFIEVSTLGILDIGASLADARAPFGQAGLLLLDPSDIAISEEANANGNFLSSAPPQGWIPKSATSVIQNHSIADQLKACNVRIHTSSDADGAAGNVLFSADVVWSTPYSLTVVADGEISIDRGVTLSNQGGGFIHLIDNFHP